MISAPTLCQIAHFTPFQAGLTFPYRVTLPQSGMPSLEGMNAVMAEKVAILEQEILESPATHAILGKVGIPGMFASTEIIGISAIHEIFVPLTQIELNDHATSQIEDRQRTHASHRGQMFRLVVTSTSENEAQGTTGAVGSMSTVGLMIHLLPRRQCSPRPPKLRSLP